MSFNRILIAVDGGDCSLSAAKIGFELAATLGAEVTTLFVFEPAVPSSGAVGLSAEELRQVASRADQSALETLRRAVDVPQGAGHVAKTGHPAEVIVHYAKSWRAGVIVVGSHGRSGVTRMVLGSVAEAVIRHASCPVLVVRKSGQADR